MIRPILEYPHPQLTQVARPVGDDEFGTEALAQIAQDLADTLAKADGLGLAATQVDWATFTPAPKVGDAITLGGDPLRVEAVAPVSANAYGHRFRAGGLWYETPKRIEATREPAHAFALADATGSIAVLINARVLDAGPMLVGEEGCLSFRSVPWMVAAPSWVTIETWDQDGRRYEQTLGGMLARAVWHETRHLEGKTMADALTGLNRRMFLRAVQKAQRAA